MEEKRATLFIGIIGDYVEVEAYIVQNGKTKCILHNETSEEGKRDVFIADATKELTDKGYTVRSVYL